MRDMVLRAVALVVLIAGGAGGQGVAFDHLACSRDTLSPCTRSARTTARNGEVILVRITNTYPDAFTYSITGIKPPALAVTEQEGKNIDPLVTYTAPIVHDKQFGGYIITVKRTGKKAPQLDDAVFTLEVTTEEWRASVAGGFAGSNLTDDALALEPVAGASPAQFTIVNDDANRDQFRRSVATFAHVSHSTRVPNLALSFGLGIDNNAGQDWFLGPSWRLGDAAAITVGGVLGSVKGPPAGKPVGSVVSDANALAGRVSRTRRGWFLAMSFSLLERGNADLKKPFKELGL